MCNPVHSIHDSDDTADLHPAQENTAQQLQPKPMVNHQLEEPQLHPATVSPDCHFDTTI